MSLEEKLEVVRRNFSFEVMLVEQLLKKHDIPVTELYQIMVEYLVPQYQQLLRERGPEGVIKTLVYLLGDCILGIPFTISENGKSYSVSFPKEKYENLKPLFVHIAGGMKIFAEIFNAESDFNLETMTHTLTFK
ncbi:MAG: hypothetical protein ACFFCZ_24310 [Promethearchaeota archaeon]